MNYFHYAIFFAKGFDLFYIKFDDYWVIAYLFWLTYFSDLF